jgi:hypothetical protein
MNRSKQAPCDLSYIANKFYNAGHVRGWFTQTLVGI